MTSRLAFTLSNQTPVEANLTAPRWLIIFVIDLSGSMAPFLEVLNQQLKDFFQIIRGHHLALASFEIAIVSIGGSDTSDLMVSLVRDFALIGDTAPDIISQATGQSPIGEALLAALELANQRKAKIKTVFNGFDNYRQPLLILCSDFQHNSPARMDGRPIFEAAVQTVNDMQKNHKLGVIKLGLGETAASEFTKLDGCGLTHINPADFAQILKDLFDILPASCPASRDELEAMTRRISAGSSGGIKDDLSAFIIEHALRDADFGLDTAL